MEDTDQTRNNRFYDTVFVDHLYIAAAVGGGGPPAAPSDLQGKSMSDSGAFLVWTDNSGNEDGFRIERSLDGSSWATAGTVGADVASFTDVGALPATSYQYLVPVQGSGKRRIRVPGTLWQRILDLDTGTRPPHRAS
jgi:hypothetical protein